MAFSSFLKGFALLALLALDVSAANSEATRRLRVDEAGGETRRRLQSKWGVWLAVIKTNLAHLPIEDRLYEQLKRIKEKMDNAKVYPIPELAFDLAMPTSSFLKILALLALLTIDVSAASLKPVRRLRGEQTQDEARSQSSRVLQNKFGWLGIVKTNVVRQPVSDKLYEKYKQIRDKVQGKDTW
uniref:RxLR effector protein n=1 Tax=Phytophthora ramorum TaxID=164328 RepID=H3GDE3_PHYRM